MHGIPIITTTTLALWSEKRSTTLITSTRAYEAVRDSLTAINIIQKQFVNTSDMQEVNKLVAGLKPTEVIYAAGGGQVADVARYIAAQWQVPIICVPTVISSDAFLVDCTGLRENGCVTYVPSVIASQVLLDWNILMEADASYHIAGCGDVLSIYTGLHDWRTANEIGKAQQDEQYDSSVALMAQSILDALVQKADELRTGSRAGITTLIQCLAMEVVLCNLYGNSRPEEGGEHFFAYCIETKLPHFMHGEIVSFGVLLTAFLQGQDWQRIQMFLDTIGLHYLPKGISRQVVIETLQELPSYTKKHNLRWSIYTDFEYEKHRTEIHKFLTRLKVPI